MKYVAKIVAGVLFLALTLVSVFSLRIISAQETPKKPTREKIIEFLDEYRNKPLSEEEKKVGWDKRELVDLVARFGTDFTELDLNSVDFDLKNRKVLAQGADFSHSNMQDAQFDGAVLRGCRFVGTNLSRALIRCCECQNADFSDSILEGTRFPYPEMQNVKFANLDATSCTFFGIDFSGSDISGTNFSGVVFDYSTKFNRTNATGTNFSGADLEETDFISTNLKNADFSGTNLKTAVFSKSNLEGCNFSGAVLYGALFEDVEGINEAQIKSLKSRSMRWFYDLTVSTWSVMESLFYPGYFLCMLIVIVYSVKGILWKERSTLFSTAIFCNSVALFSTLCTVLMLLSGGHPVRQMSLGNMDMWSFWLRVWPVLACVMLAVIACLIVAFIICVSILTMRRKIVHPWGTLFYLLLSIAHAFFALNWLSMFAPDA